MHHGHAHTPVAHAYDAVVTGEGTAAHRAAGILGWAGHRTLLIDTGTSPCTEALPDVTVLGTTVSEVSGIARGLRVTCTDGTVEYTRALLVTSGTAAGMPDDPRIRVADTPTAAETAAGDIDVDLTREKADAEAEAEDSGTDWSGVSASDYWEQAYANAQVRWSGRPNTALVSVLGDAFGTDAGQDAAPGSRGRAADIGSGEGADVVWLAGQGWDTTGVEVSATAARRAAEVAAAAGVSDRARFTDGGLLAFRDSGAGELDLVTASYLHNPSQDHRESLLHTAGSLVGPAGHLFVLSHVTHEHLDAGTGTDIDAAAHPDDAAEIGALGLDPAEWSLVRGEDVRRTVLTPGGDVVETADRALLLRRFSPGEE